MAFPSLHDYRSPWLDSIQGRLRHFIHLEVTSGLLLILCTLVAMGWANSPWREGYHHLWHLPVALQFGEWKMQLSLHHLINDGLMVIFFFVIGLEVKREVLVGELSSLRDALLPLVAAVGGMVVPALLYVLCNTDGPGQPGWGIPMATDIAFSLGVLALFGKRIPISAKIFLTALAIADDLGAILVIAIFYSGDSISWMNLQIGLLSFALLIICNVIGVRSVFPYAIIGVCGVWGFMLESGVHATVAGILAAMAIPARPRKRKLRFVEEAEELLNQFRNQPEGRDEILRDPEAQDQLEHLHAFMKDVDSPLARLERRLHPWVSLGILPLFALANAGVTLVGGGAQTVGGPIVAGVALGLVLGKPLGVFGASWLAIKLGLAHKPESFTWGIMAGIACLTGIGFTMSLFIAGLAFADAALLDQARLGVLGGSLLAGLLGGTWLWHTLRRQPAAAG